MYTATAFLSWFLSCERLMANSTKKVDSAKAERKNTSLRLEKKTLKALKIRAIEEDISVQQLIERLIVDYLQKSSK